MRICHAKQGSQLQSTHTANVRQCQDSLRQPCLQHTPSSGCCALGHMGRGSAGCRSCLRHTRGCCWKQHRATYSIGSAVRVSQVHEQAPKACSSCMCWHKQPPSALRICGLLELSEPQSRPHYNQRRRRWQPQHTAQQLAAAGTFTCRCAQRGGWACAGGAPGCGTRTPG